MSVFAAFFCFSTAQILPGVAFFFTPSAAQMQPANASLFNGPFGLCAAAAYALMLFVLHGTFRRRLYGPVLEVRSDKPLARRIRELSNAVGVPIKHIYLGQKPERGGAVAFGSRNNQSILLGFRMCAVAGVQPRRFSGLIAHELCHFKNGDIQATFFSRSLWLSCLVLSGVSLFILAIEPLRYTLASLVGFPSIHAFLKYQGYYSLINWWNSFEVLMIHSAPSLLFWLTIVRMEYLAFLRFRELLADVRASRFVGVETMRITLGGEPSSNGNFWQRFKHLFRAHPTISQRLQAIERPVSVAYFPVMRFFSFGFLYAEAFRASVKVMSTLPAVFSALRNLLIVPSGLTKYEQIFQFSDAWASSIILFFAVLPCVVFLIAAMSCLSHFMAMILDRKPVLRLTGELLAFGILYGLGYFIGSVLDPYGHYIGIGLHRINEINFFDSLDLIAVAQASVITFCFLLTALFQLAAVGLLFKGYRRRKPMAVEWFFLTLTSYLLALQLGFPLQTLVLMHKMSPLTIPSGFWRDVGCYALLWLLAVRIVAGTLRGKSDEERLIWLSED